MPNRLYLIGNGFDLHHGLKTRYAHFGAYLEQHDRPLYHLLESYIAFPQTDKDLWARFEENLANLDVEEIIDENRDRLPDYGSDEFRDRDRYVFPDIMEELYNDLTTGLIDQFRSFILQVEMPPSAHQYMIELDPKAEFLNFNFTHTLERLYGVDRNRILYIHGVADNENSEIILGHGIDPAAFEEKSPEPPNGLDEDDLAKWYDEHDIYDYSFDTGKEAIMRYFATMYKPTKDIITHHQSFFEGLGTIKEVYVLGHSISYVDLPYFKTIFKHVDAQAQWTVSFYSEEERESHLKTLCAVGIDKHKIRLIELSDLQTSNQQMKIDFGRN
jgi:hypothetical protein